ncbi:NfeD family protein [uncultured Ruminococcus sp.]|uniref:NfeD family protein n=1 Tax=uncultured Ruminococcus sp. TaxID=165186 RepID=UPI00292F14CC|nr:NfeD family protein [uncultured Ruminococcus sp.]
MSSMTIFWLVLAIVMAVLEAATVQLVSIWFCVGAIGACISSLMTDSIVIQAAVFIVVSGLALIATRPLVKKMKNRASQPTNADRYVGKSAIVIQSIDNEKAEGMVKVDNQKWTARSATGMPIPEGERVIVTAIEGVKLIVEAVKTQ